MSSSSSPCSELSSATLLSSSSVCSAILLSYSVTYSAQSAFIFWSTSLHHRLYSLQSPGVSIPLFCFLSFFFFFVFPFSKLGSCIASRVSEFCSTSTSLLLFLDFFFLLIVATFISLSCTACFLCSCIKSFQSWTLVRFDFFNSTSFISNFFLQIFTCSCRDRFF